MYQGMIGMRHRTVIYMFAKCTFSAHAAHLCQSRPMICTSIGQYKQRMQHNNTSTKRLQNRYYATAKDAVCNTSVRAIVAETAATFTSNIFSIIPKYRLLHDLCGKGDLAGVRRCIAEGADVSDADDIGLTPLHCAAQTGHTEIARELIRAGAIVDSEAVGFYYESKTPLWYALWFNKDITTASVLRDYGANINHQDKDGNTLLHRAILQKRTDVVRKILALGANINIPNKEGVTSEQLLLDKQ